MCLRSGTVRTLVQTSFVDSALGWLGLYIGAHCIWVMKSKTNWPDQFLICFFFLLERIGLSKPKSSLPSSSLEIYLLHLITSLSLSCSLSVSIFVCLRSSLPPIFSPFKISGRDCAIIFGIPVWETELPNPELCFSTMDSTSCLQLCGKFLLIIQTRLASNLPSWKLRIKRSIICRVELPVLFIYRHLLSV